MMQTVQLAIVDSVYAAALREALARSGPWHVECVCAADPGETCVLVLDEESLGRLRLPLPCPERVVLITRKDPEKLSHAWDLGIVSVVSANDPPSTILLAIMAAALRVPKPQPAASCSGISPNRPVPSGPISPSAQLSGAKRCKTH
jgi:hypothetical protein